MRLRNLRKLEEMEIRAEDKALQGRAHGSEVAARLDAEAVEDGRRRRSRRSARQFGPKTALGKRRTGFRRGAGARRGGDRRSDGGPRAGHRRRLGEGLDPRVARPRQPTCRASSFKAGDSLQFAFPTESTAKVLLFASNGRFYTIDAVEAAGRPRLRRADPALCRHGAGHRDRRGDARIRAAANSWSPARTATALSWRRTNASPPPARARQVLNLKDDEARALAAVSKANWSPRRREPQDADFRRSTTCRKWTRGRGVRSAALQGEGAVRRHDLQGGRGPDLDRHRGARLSRRR